MLVGGKVVLMPRDKAHLMASEVPLIDSMGVEVVTVGVVKREVKLYEVWEWRWMKVTGHPWVAPIYLASSVNLSFSLSLAVSVSNPFWLRQNTSTTWKCSGDRANSNWHA